MPKRRYERREPTDNWQQLRPLLKDSAQITYEVIRPVVLWGVTPKQLAAETGMSQRTIYYRANLFDAAGMASLLPAEPPPPIPKQDKRALPPPIRQEIVDLRAEYPAFRPHEIATICFVKFGRRPSPQTIKLILASGPKPLRGRRFKRFAELKTRWNGGEPSFGSTLKAGSLVFFSRLLGTGRRKYPVIDFRRHPRSTSLSVPACFLSSISAFSQIQLTEPRYTCV